MTSKLEDALIQDHRANEKLRKTFFNSLDEHSLRSLRRTSKLLNTEIVSQTSDRIFKNLYVYAPLRENDSIRILEHLTPHCQHLTLRVQLPPKALDNAIWQRWESSLQVAPVATVASTSSKRTLNPFKRASNIYDRQLEKHRAQKERKKVQKIRPPNKDLRRMDRRIWEYLFHQFPILNTITFRIQGNPAWPGMTELEEMIVMLRYCLERTCPSNLRHIHFKPIHAFGLIHMRWAGFGAFYEIPTVGMKMWENITTLTLHLRNPLIVNLDSSKDPIIPPINTHQHTHFLSSLTAYLRSFRRTLKCLEFVWLHIAGPSPMLLLSLEWTLLESFSFGNITMPNQTIQLIPEFAPRVIKCKVLKDTHRDKPEAGDAWLEIPMEKIRRGSMRMDHPAFRGSRVYQANSQLSTARQSVVSMVPKPLQSAVTTRQSDMPETPKNQSTHLRFSKIRQALKFTDDDESRSSMYSQWTQR